MTDTMDVLVGKTMKEVFAVIKDGWDQATELHFITEDGEHYVFFHEQDCCESVYIESIVGDLEDLVGTSILKVEEAISEDGSSPTWTFYKFATIKGYVDVRWCGESNGYYSESVDFKKLG